MTDRPFQTIDFSTGGLQNFFAFPIPMHPASYAAIFIKSRERFYISILIEFFARPAQKKRNRKPIMTKNDWRRQARIDGSGMHRAFRPAVLIQG
jgi:hypothetical protein